MDLKLSENILTGLDGAVKVNGKLSQVHVLSDMQKQVQYQLSYEVIELAADKNYFLSYLTYEDGTVHTYFFPIQFLGPQKITFDVPFAVTSIQFSICGQLTLKDTKLQSVLTNELTEEQKIALDKVGTNSDYWDRIIAVTSALGNILTDKLEGSINTALNSIAGSEGRMYWEDGKFICRDGRTDAESTMAMVLSPAGFMIADSKLADGNWKWRTFGTGAGFTADEIIAGTLRAIAVEGVTITASTLTGGTIVGATIKGGSLNIADKYIVDSMGDVQMLGNITWGATNSPVKVKYSSDNTNWHVDFQVNDTFAKYSYDGGLTWTTGIKIRGTDGANGLPGNNGADGKTYFTWIAYADDSIGTGISLSAANKKYIGIAYNQTTQTPQLTASKYSWSKVQGEDGLNGSDGLPGQNGIDGKTYYTWIKYADDASGTGMSNVSTGKAYIGIAYNKETATESNTPGDYTWTKIKGETGATGPQGPAGSDANVPAYITSTKITGTTVESCTLSGNTITGSTIKGSTMIGGSESGVYTKISPNDPLAVYRATGKVGEIWGNTDGSSYLRLYDRTGTQKIGMSSGASSSSTTDFTDTGSMNFKVEGALNITGQSGFNIYAWNRTSSPYLELYRSYMIIGNPFIETWIDGTTVYIKGVAKGLTITELEVQNLELQAENQSLALKQSEMEVTLMEKGIL